MCSAVFITGLLNILFVKGDRELKDPLHSMWKHFFELKIILALFITPLIDPMTKMFAEEGDESISDDLKSKIQFYIVVFLAFYSSFIRYFREYVCMDFKVDMIMKKVQQLQDRYEESSKSEAPLATPPPSKQSKQTGLDKLKKEKVWMEKEQEDYLQQKRASRSHPSSVGGTTGGTGAASSSKDIQKQIEKLM